jgi:hypothetical protein
MTKLIVAFHNFGNAPTKVKDQAVLIYAMKAYRGSKSMAPTIFPLGTS